MKLLLTISALVILFSCKKEIPPEQKNNSLIAKIKVQLKDSMKENDLQGLDFQNAGIINFPTNDLSILKIPFLNKSYENDFILLKIEKNETFSRGKIISINRYRPETDSQKALIYNGKIIISTLSGIVTTNSLIVNGFVQAFLKNENIVGKPLVAPVKYTNLPDVAVVGHYPADNGPFTTWYNIQSLFMDTNIYIGGGGNGGGGGGGGNISGYYSNSTSGTTTGGGSTYAIDPKLVDFEPVESLQAIDVSKYVKCFGALPDRTATCSIKILTDIPVDSDPMAYFNTSNGSPGHTFIQLTKTSGGQTVQQNIGFYPVQGWKNITSQLPVEGKFVDNAEHEFNASLTMSLTPDQFQKTLDHIVFLSKIIKYDLAQSNCTDFALEVFNYQRGTNQLVISPFNIPGNSAPNGTKTPQALYIRLKGIKEKTTNPDSKNVTLPGVKGFAGNSNGPCN